MHTFAFPGIHPQNAGYESSAHSGYVFYENEHCGVFYGSFLPFFYYSIVYFIFNYRYEFICLLAAALALLGKELELSLLGLVAGLHQMLQSLLAAFGSLAAHNATMLVVLHGTAGQTAGSVVSSTVHDLGTSANGFHSATCHAGSCLTMLACAATGFTSVGHFLPRVAIFFKQSHEKSPNQSLSTPYLLQNSKVYRPTVFHRAIASYTY